MAALLDIYNLALLRIKERPLISGDTTSRPAQACEFSYRIQRPALLRRHRWQFALRRVALTALAEAPAFGWQYQMALPADFNTLVSASPWYDSARHTLTDEPHTYRIENTALLADNSPMYVLYVRDETNPARFDPLFVNTLTAYLASDLALALAADASLSDQMTKAGEAALLAARRANSVEQPSEAVLGEGRLLGDRVAGVSNALGRANPNPGGAATGPSDLMQWG